jgi:predicted RNA binding protein YcfA (HicA-like mRNA interferase family)
MPRLPVVSGKRAIKALEYLGYEKKRQRGSHVVMRKGDIGCVVPLHKELKAGTLAGIIRQSGLTVEEFLGAL